MVLVLLVGAGLVLGGFPAVYGQEEKEEKAEEKAVFTLDEIVVTATKREENILEVPISMSAFNSDMIDRLGMTSQDDLEQLTPGLQFGDNNEKIGQGTVIRGIGSRLHGETHSDLAVATYVNGIYSGDLAGIAPNFFDLERVEVARGPQGTLHGRNSIGGSISFFTKRPTAEWDADVLVEFTDQVTQRYNIAFGGPILDWLHFRITGGYHEGDGAQENIGLGGDYDAPDQTFIMPQLRLKTDRFDVNLSYSRTEDTGVPRAQSTVSERDRTSEFLPTGATNPWYLFTEPIPTIADCDPGQGGNKCSDLDNKINVNAPGVMDNTRESFTVNADYTITDSLTLRYNYGESRIDTLTSRDSDQSNRIGGWQGNLSLSADAGVPFVDERMRFPYIADESSHELLLLSNFDSPLNFIVGAYYFQNTDSWSVYVDNYSSIFRFTDLDTAWPIARESGIENWFPPYFGNDKFDTCDEFADTAVNAWFGEWTGATGNRWPARCGSSTDNLMDLDYTTTGRTETKAVFGSIDYRFSDQWQVTAGLRYTQDGKKGGNHFGWFAFNSGAQNIGFFVDFDNSVPQQDDWDAYIWNLGVEYTPEGTNTMIYGRIATGYRAGAFNTSNPFFPRRRIEEETSINYEIGLKSLSMDQRLQVTSAAFYMDYDGFQINLTQPFPPDVPVPPTAATPLTEYTANIDGTSVWGAEFEISYYLTDQLQLSGYYTYLDSEIGPHSSVTPGDPDAPTGDHQQLVIPTDGSEPYYQAVPYTLPTDKTGNQLAMQPNHKFAVTAAYTMPIPSLSKSSMDLGTLQFLTTYSYTGDRHPFIANLESQEMIGYGRWDIRAQWTSESGHWSSGLFVQNVLDEIGLIEFVPVSTNAGTPAMGTLTDARRFGFFVRWKM